MHETSLITMIVAGLVLAFAGGLAATKLRLPPLVGYLLAGVAVGPFTPGFVGDEALASQLAEIGVILLMFGVGLHFSIKDLLAVRRIAIPGAVGQIAVATAMGVGIASLWGWPLGAGLVFGLSLSVASTVVLLRALEQRNAIDTINGRIAVGWLIVEDLAMVLALVLLPALAGPLGGTATAAAGSAGEVALLVATTLGKVAVFLAVVLIVGAKLIPWILHHVARTGSRELFTLAVLAVALGIAYSSAEFSGASFALGAFFAGVVLSGTDYSHKAAADSLPLQDAFAVLFFVSVGMLFDPGILVREPLAVLAVVAVIMFGKSLAAFGIVLAFGHPVSTALTVSASLAQIGEFSFILAGLGAMLGLLPDTGRDLILAGALLSIALNPLVFALIDPLNGFFQKRPALLRRLERAGDASLLTLTANDSGPSDHAVIVGYGRVGGRVGKVLESLDFPFVIVDQDRRRIEALRKGGQDAIYGDAATPGVLAAAGVSKARLIIIATPSSFQTQRIIESARQAKPDIKIAVRAHSDQEVAEFNRSGVGVTIMGEHELAIGLLEYALASFDVEAADTRAILSRARAAAVHEDFGQPPTVAVPETRRRAPD